MTAVKDIQIDDAGITILNGDFKLHESDEFHIQTILKSEKSAFFEEPLMCLGIISELNGSKSSQQLKQDIRRQLVYDNYDVQVVSLKDGGVIDINAIRLK